MEWYYAEGGQQRGPVSPEEFEGLVAGGTVKPDTLVWRAGMVQWQRYAEVMGSMAEQSDGAGGGQGGMACSQCGKLLPPEEGFRYGSSWVCADCKPGVMQALRVTGSTETRSAEVVSADELLRRGYAVDVGACLNRSWEMATSNVGLVVLATLLLALLIMAMNLVLLFVPGLSTVLAWALTGPLLGGYWVFLLKLLRRDDASFSEVSSQIGPRVGSLLLAGLITGLLEFLCLAPTVGLLLAILAFNGVISWSAAPDLNQWGALVIVGVGLVSLVGFAGWVYLSVSWLFVLPLVADRGLGCWSAMRLSRAVVGQHWWWTLLLALLRLGLIGLGYLACLIGSLFFFPLGLGLLAAHFLVVFGDLEQGAG